MLFFYGECASHTAKKQYKNKKTLWFVEKKSNDERLSLGAGPLSALEVRIAESFTIFEGNQVSWVGILIHPKISFFPLNTVFC